MYSFHFYTSLSNVLKHLHSVFIWPMCGMIYVGLTLNKLVSMFVVLKEHECR